MTIREKVIEVIEGMSDAEVEAEYVHLRETAGHLAGDDEFEDALDALAATSGRVSGSTDAAQLIRDGRHWMASRAR